MARKKQKTGVCRLVKAIDGYTYTTHHPADSHTYVTVSAILEANNRCTWYHVPDNDMTFLLEHIFIVTATAKLVTPWRDRPPGGLMESLSQTGFQPIHDVMTWLIIWRHNPGRWLMSIMPMGASPACPHRLPYWPVIAVDRRRKLYRVVDCITTPMAYPVSGPVIGAGAVSCGTSDTRALTTPCEHGHWEHASHRVIGQHYDHIKSEDWVLRLKTVSGKPPFVFGDHNKINSSHKKFPISDPVPFIREAMNPYFSRLGDLENLEKWPAHCGFLSAFGERKLRAWNTRSVTITQGTTGEDGEPLGDGAYFYPATWSLWESSSSTLPG